ncbi:VMAP-C domain-containing protein [Actinacidiphila acididurans]|uniref:Trypsin-like peptidase domain-containing protein n=1 Tax=Actinacidiphila acididurans TaxID=2784346 RepID=A0ABS2TM85_9ACTN|nr:trypsin-like peptidase domain-containing protein [Actinacidiphila acididurans]MBM9503606.1 trypsin-like peptidase domain-containing protein [Actinacidiphila acididurans]
MTPAGGPDEPVDPAEILVPLVGAATVRIHGPQPGNPLRGSGFFVAPGWVLTCAHVALAGQEESVGAARRVTIGYGDALLGGVVEWADPDVPPGADPGHWPAPDLALVRLLDHVEHPCVWLTERTAKGYTTNQVAFFGWIDMDGELYEYNGRCTISGQLGAGSGGILKLGNEDEMPRGVSGGPVVDLVRGEVIGVLKARRSARDGGLAVGIQQLRKLPVAKDPQDDLYHRVMTAHDLHHADRHSFAPGNEITWTDAHAEIGASAGRALTPGSRTHLLGLLAQLPPPAGARGVQDIVTEVRGSPVQGIPLAPRAWRDGLGLLYDLRRGSTELEAVLRYAVHAATADRSHPADEAAERALWRWAQDTAAESPDLTRIFRTTLMEERRTRLRSRGAVTLERLPAHRPRTEALLEIIPRGWEPGRYDWRVCVVPVNGEVDCVDEDFHGTAITDLPGRLAEPLAEAFRRCDEPGHTATLQLAVPGALVGLAADTWQLRPGARVLGADRPVVTRRTDLPPDEDPAVTAERQDRWRAQHQRRLAPEVLDCDEAESGPLPEDPELRELTHECVPVLCRSAITAPQVLHRLVAGGHSVALWRREPVPPQEPCADYHRGIERTVRGARTAGGLPAALAALRSDLADGAPEAYWSAGLMLLYDDPTRPLPGTDELLETP